MNIDGTEKTEGKVCTKCGEWKPLDEYNKHKLGKYGRQSKCRECQKEYKKQWHQNNKEYCKEYGKQWRGNNPEYRKQHHQNNKEYYKEQHKQWKENNEEHLKEYKKQWRENNKEYIKQYYQNNKEYYKELNRQWRENNKEYTKEYRKQWYENNPEYSKQWKENNKRNNLQYISSIVEQINPVFKQLNLPVYGYVYIFENVKTGHVYVGQTTTPLNHRYKKEITKGWIKERLKCDNQKFKEELIEEDIKVTEILDVAFCQYHLDKLEAYYIDKYDSCNNGYNNCAGNHDTVDGIEEFNQILKENGLQFIDGKLIAI